MGIKVCGRFAWLTDGQTETFEPIEVGIYEPDPEHKGCLKHVQNKTIKEVYKELCERLKNEECLPDEYFLTCCSIKFTQDKKFPPYRWIACYPITGSNEGHYIHVECVVLMSRL